MRLSSVLASTLSLTLATLALADAASDVIDLTPSNINSVVDSEKIILVEFFAPWYSFVFFSSFLIVTRCVLLKVRALQGACSSLRGSGNFPQRKGYQSRQSELRRRTRLVPSTRCPRISVSFTLLGNCFFH